LPYNPKNAIIGNKMSDFGIMSRAIALASRLKTERKARKMTITEFAHRAGIKARTYSHFEHTGEISLERLIRALVVLGRADEIESLVRPSRNFSSLIEMEKSLAAGGGR
jgi:transcriptional regulator with XRE-family HTH domain